ncbi:MAG: hypothetical protein ACOC5K_03335 [Chloroflexota bacterium]
MEALAVLVVPLLIIVVGMGLLTNRPPTPGRTIRGVLRSSRTGLRLLWKDRSQRGGGGRVRDPRYRYRR